MSTEAWVYTGVWTDWAEGRIVGSRFTVTTNSAMYVIAFLALFVRFVGQHFWSIFRYIYFQTRVSGTAEDGLFHEQQVLLRNSSSDDVAAWQFLRVGRAWHGLVPGALRRSFDLILWASANVLAFTAASIFVSTVATTTSGFLLRGPICGTWVNPFAFNENTDFTAYDLQARNKWQGWHVENVKAASIFSQQCYNTTDAMSSLANCKAYGPSLLNWTSQVNVRCPFDDKMCVNNLAVRFDSGLLDSQIDFGINSQHDRVKYRTVLECAPIAQEDYRSDLLLASAADTGSIVSSGMGDVLAEEELREYYYGESWYFNTSSTFIWTNLSFGMPLGNQEIPRYGLDVENSVLGNLESGTFTAIPELNRTDADVVLFFLMSHTSYLNEVRDPWFQATLQHNITQQAVEQGGHPATVTFHLQNNNASVLGCAQQHQFCNHDASRCSPLTGGAAGGNREAMLRFASDLNLTPRETAVQRRLYQAAWNNWVYQTSGYLEGDGLLAAGIGSNDVSSGLPDDQWIFEIQSWFATGLTGMQMELTMYATGPQDTSDYQYLTLPTNTDEEWMCENQIVQRDGYSNLSGLGVGLVVGIGGFIILVDLFLPRAIQALKPIWSATQALAGGDDWDSMEALQLMRTAYESNGLGGWQGQPGEVPVTRSSQKLGPPHAIPNLIARSAGSSTVDNESRWDLEQQMAKTSKGEDIREGLVFSDTIENNNVIR